MAATPYNYLVATLTNCYITSHSTGGGSSGMPTQSVSIAYEQISSSTLPRTRPAARPSRLASRFTTLDKGSRRRTRTIQTKMLLESGGIFMAAVDGIVKMPALVGLGS